MYAYKSTSISQSRDRMAIALEALRRTSGGCRTLALQHLTQSLASHPRRSIHIGTSIPSLACALAGMPSVDVTVRAFLRSIT